jgi:hypothetical protein
VHGVTADGRCGGFPPSCIVGGPFPSWNRSILTEIYLCHACSCPEVLRTETAGQVSEGQVPSPQLGIEQQQRQRQQRGGGGADGSVVQMHTGSVRGAGWAKFFESVRRDTLARRAAERRRQGAGRKDESRIGVFCCGPMGADLRQNCVKFSAIVRGNDDATPPPPPPSPPRRRPPPAPLGGGAQAPPQPAADRVTGASAPPHAADMMDIRFQLHAEVF